MPRMTCAVVLALLLVPACGGEEDTGHLYRCRVVVWCIQCIPGELDPDGCNDYPPRRTEVLEDFCTSDEYNTATSVEYFWRSSQWKNETDIVCEDTGQSCDEWERAGGGTYAVCNPD